MPSIRRTSNRFRAVGAEVSISRERELTLVDLFVCVIKEREGPRHVAFGFRNFGDRLQFRLSSKWLSGMHGCKVCCYSDRNQTYDSCSGGSVLVETETH